MLNSRVITGDELLTPICMIATVVYCRTWIIISLQSFSWAIIRFARWLRHFPESKPPVHCPATTMELITVNKMEYLVEVRCSFVRGVDPVPVHRRSVCPTGWSALLSFSLWLVMSPRHWIASSLSVGSVAGLFGLMAEILSDFYS